MQLDGGDAGGVELLRELLGAVLGAREHHTAPGCRGEVEQHRPGGPSWLTLSTWCAIVETGDCAESAWCVTGLDMNFLVTSTSTPASSVAEKSSRWVPFGVFLEDAAHRGQEPEVGHVVGLVEDGDLDAAKVQVTLGDEVLQATGARDDDVDASPEPGDLGVLADAAEHGDRVEAAGCGEGGESGVDLGHQLTGRREDQRPGAPGSAGPGRR